ncbi:MAG: hypothetical protein PVH88_25840 [Ignavibacteria bacterium]|jgi:hypothetical protein
MKTNPLELFDYSKEHELNFLIENRKGYNNNFKIIIDPMPNKEEIQTDVIYEEDEVL